MNSPETEKLKQRTKEFAHSSVKVAAELPATPLGNTIRGQLIRCATSTASNYRAVCLAQSRAAFVAKMSIVLEEADESCFWLEFARDEGMLHGAEALSVVQEARELTAIFAASRKTAQEGRR